VVTWRRWTHANEHPVTDRRHVKSEAIISGDLKCIDLPDISPRWCSLAKRSNMRKSEADIRKNEPDSSEMFANEFDGAISNY
jgi:hypothetical protein